MNPVQQVAFYFDMQFSAVCNLGGRVLFRARSRGCCDSYRAARETWKCAMWLDMKVYINILKTHTHKLYGLIFTEVRLCACIQIDGVLISVPV